MIGRFRVAVQDVRRVNVLEAAVKLVDDVTYVVVGKLLFLQLLIEVRLHQSYM